RTRALSASGSRKAPDRVVPMRRASQPSTPSVAARTDQMAAVPYAGPEAMINPHSNGARTKRVVVTALAGGARAEGPNEPATTEPRLDRTRSWVPPPRGRGRR